MYFYITFIYFVIQQNSISEMPNKNKYIIYYIIYEIRSNDASKMSLNLLCVLEVIKCCANITLGLYFPT